MSFIKILKRVWHFIWYDDSLLSWFVNLVLAFVIVKFIIYPGVGYLLSTDYPIVAVVSGSMEHNGLGFDAWWNQRGKWYEDRSVSKEDFKKFSFVSGFNKGDIMLLKGIEPKDIKIGDVVVYENSEYRNPIIHRVISMDNREGRYYFKTKGDNNPSEDRNEITEGQVKRTGKAIIRVPLLGWFKIIFVDVINKLVGA